MAIRHSRNKAWNQSVPWNALLRGSSVVLYFLEFKLGTIIHLSTTSHYLTHSDFYWISQGNYQFSWNIHWNLPRSYLPSTPRYSWSSQSQGLYSSLQPNILMNCKSSVAHSSLQQYNLINLECSPFRILYPCWSSLPLFEIYESNSRGERSRRQCRSGWKRRLKWTPQSWQFFLTPWLPNSAKQIGIKFSKFSTIWSWLVYKAGYSTYYLEPKYIP